MKKSSGIKVIIIAIVLVVGVMTYYYYLSNVKESRAREEMVTTTKVQDALMRDLTKNYPPTAKEVVRYYSELTQCVHNEEYGEEDFSALAEKMHSMYDDELAEKNPIDKYEDDLKFDIDLLRNKGVAISSYTASPSTDVDYFSKNGYDCAKLRCVYTLRVGSKMEYVTEIFVLRKDADGHWKIFGWEAENAKDGAQASADIR